MKPSLRVARVEAALYSPVSHGGQPVSTLHPQLDALIRRYLPPITASLLAAPVPSGDGAHMEWYSDLSGQPVPLSHLTPTARAQVETLMAERLSALQALAARLDVDPAQGHLAGALRLAAGTPRPEDVFVVSGQPVITQWGQIGQAAPRPIVAPPVVAEAIVPKMVWWRRFLRWRWLFLVLAILLLLGLLFKLRGCDVIWPGSGDLGGQSSADLMGLQADEAKLKAEADSLEAELRGRLDACPMPQTKQDDAAPVPLPKTPLRKPDVTPEPIAPEKNVPEKKGPEKPVPPVEKPQTDSKPPVTKPPVTPQQTVVPPQTQSKACPPPRQKWEAPEVVVLLDASGSMGLSAGVSQEQITGLYRRAILGDPAAQAQLNGMYNQPGKSRLDVAKQSLLSTLPHLPSDVDVGLIVLGSCKEADNYKFFGSKDRGRLSELLSGIVPLNGTPLARGIERAGNMMDGTSVPGVLVVLSDGDDSCGGDPCAAARALAQRKPKLKINFIDVNGDGSGACVVQPSGGKVYSPHDIAELPDLVRKASEQPEVPPGCPQ